MIESRHPLTRFIPSSPPPPANDNRPPLLPSTTHIRHGYGLVGTGTSPALAQADLLEKMQQARGG
jgi:hypothetical protein